MPLPEGRLDELHKRDLKNIKVFNMLDKLFQGEIFKKEKNIERFIIQGQLVPENKIFIGDLGEAERVFGQGYQLLIRKDISERQFEYILLRLSRGQALTEWQRQQVMTAREFYTAHQRVFTRRARETASTGAERRFLVGLLSQHVPRDVPILDAGCGLGRLTLPLMTKHKFNMYGIDVSHVLLEIGNKRAEKKGFGKRFFEASLVQTPFPSNSFGAVLMMWHVICEVHEHLDAVFAEVHRILKPGGLVVLDFPDIGTDDTRIHYEGSEGKENYSQFLAKVPQMGVLKQTMNRHGFAILNTHHLKWGIHKYVVVARRS